jgi:hypothetical protein
MKYDKVSKISAIGTGKINKGREFVAKPNVQGQFVLHRKSKQTNLAENKILVASLTDAANLLATDEFVINLTCEQGTRALGSYGKVCIK